MRRRWLAMAAAAAAALILTVSGCEDMTLTPAEQAYNSSINAEPLVPSTELTVSSLWIGDSYTAGVGQSAPDGGEASLTGAAMGWVTSLDAQGGTGFVASGIEASATYRPLPARLAADRVNFPNVDVVAIDAGRNDLTVPLAELKPVIAAFDHQVRADWPHATIIEITPYYLTTTADPDVGQLAAFISDQMTAVHGYTVDPVADGWIPAPAGLLYTDGIHPNAAGHRYIAAHLTADLRALGLGRIPT